MHIEPYLFFNGRAEEAIEFYRRQAGAELLGMMRMKESPEPPPPDRVVPGTADKIMHAAIRIGQTNVMISDGMATGGPEFKGFSLSISVENESRAKELFAALGDGGAVQMPLGKTFFSPCFGMVADRFGVGWMVIVPGDYKMP